MRARLVPRIRLENRTALQDVIPLETPFHIFIDPSSACNFNCQFCFHCDKSRPFHSIMKYDLFTKIIDDLLLFPQRLKVLKLYAFGEPLLNKRLPDMIRYIKQKNVTDSVEFTTNGWWLSPQKNYDLLSSGLDAIVISVGGLSAENFRDICRREVDFDSYVDNIRDFYVNRGRCRVHIKTTTANVCEKEKDIFFTIFGNIADEISIDNVAPIWPDLKSSSVFSNPERNIYNQEIRRVNVCPYIFYHLTVHADGNVSTCFIDWEQRNVIGNVKEESLYEIWHGKKLNAIRKAHLSGQRSRYDICADCGQLTYGMADNIDDYSRDLLEKMKMKYS